MDLSGRVAIVTGSSRGIGAATAKALSREKASVVVNYLTGAEMAEEVVKEIKGKGGNAIAFQADVTERKDAERLVRAAIKEFGQVDILVNNAFRPMPSKSFLDLTWEECQDQIDRSLKAAFNCVQAVVPKMMERGSGKIINIVSVLVDKPVAGALAYTAAKSALIGFTRTIALELGPHGICVNMVSPGITLTEGTMRMEESLRNAVALGTPMRRLATPDDIAGAVLFLASDLASFITGSYFPVSGGYVMS